MNQLRKHKGVITVFMLIIFFSMFTLSGVLIDVGRVMAAQRKVENAMNTTARSILAGYDKFLIGDYGVYAYYYNSGKNKDEKPSIDKKAMEYLKLNLEQENESINLFDFQIDNVQVNCMGNLMEDEVLMNQINQYMETKKYIIGAEWLADKIVNIKSTMKKTDNAAEKVQAIMKDEEKIKDIKNKIKKKFKDFVLNEIANGFKYFTKKSVARIYNYSSGNQGEMTYKEITYEKIQDIDKLQENVIQLKGKTRENIGNMINEIGVLQDKIKQHQVEMKELKESIKNVSDEYEKLAGQSVTYENEVNYSGELKTEDEIIDQNIVNLENNKQKLKDLEKRYDQIYDNILTCINKLSTLYSKGNKSEKDINKINELHSELEGLRKELVDLTKEDIEINLIKNEYEVPEFNGIDAAMEEIEALYETLKGTATNILVNLFLNQLKEENIFENKNKLIDILEEIPFYQHNPVVVFFNSIEKVNGIINNIQNAKDSLHLNTYIMDRFMFLTTKTQFRTHFFGRGEVEYILRGEKVQLDNIIDVLREIWYIRFAVNSIDRFITMKTPPPGEAFSTAARIGIAVVEGSLMATKDVVELVQGKQVPFIHSIGKDYLGLKYSDYLYLLLCTVPTDVKLMRMRTLMQQNIRQYNDNFRVNNYNTALEMEAEVKVNLIFLPMILGDNIEFKNYRDGKYIIRKKVYAGY